MTVDSSIFKPAIVALNETGMPPARCIFAVHTGQDCTHVPELVEAVTLAGSEAAEHPTETVTLYAVEVREFRSPQSLWSALANGYGWEQRSVVLWERKP